MSSANSSFDLIKTPFRKQVINASANNTNENGNKALEVLETPMDKINKSVNTAPGNSLTKKNKNNRSSSIFVNKKLRKQGRLVDGGYKSTDELDMRPLEGASNEMNTIHRRRHFSNSRKIGDHMDQFLFSRNDSTNTSENPKTVNNRTIRNNIINMTIQNIESPTSSSNFYDTNNFFNNNTFQRKASTNRPSNGNTILPAALEDTPFFLLNKYNTAYQDGHLNSKGLPAAAHNSKDFNYTQFFTSKYKSKNYLFADKKKQRIYRMEQNFHKTLHNKHQPNEKERIDLNFMCCDEDSEKRWNNSPRKSRSIIKGLKLFDSKAITKKTRRKPEINYNHGENKKAIKNESTELLESIVRDVNLRKESANGASLVDMYLTDTINLVYNIG